jgi:hypothetical protein
MCLPASPMDQTRTRDDRRHCAALRDQSGSGNAIWGDCPVWTSRVGSSYFRMRSAAGPIALPLRASASSAQNDHPATVHQGRTGEAGSPMNPRLAHLLMCLYPRPWRERYSAEFEALPQTGRGDLRRSANVVWSALLMSTSSQLQDLERIKYPRAVVALTKQPSAFLPLAMSLTALAVVLGHVAICGVVHEPDEGATAHIWQLLMAGDAGTGALRYQVAATSSETDAVCTCTASQSCDRINVPRLFSPFVNWDF